MKDKGKTNRSLVYVIIIGASSSYCWFTHIMLGIGFLFTQKEAFYIELEVRVVREPMIAF